MTAPRRLHEDAEGRSEANTNMATVTAVGQIDRPHGWGLVQMPASSEWGCLGRGNDMDIARGSALIERGLGRNEERISPNGSVP